MMINDYGLDVGWYLLLVIWFDLEKFDGVFVEKWKNFCCKKLWLIYFNRYVL